MPSEELPYVKQGLYEWVEGWLNYHDNRDNWNFASNIRTSILWASCGRNARRNAYVRDLTQSRTGTSATLTVEAAAQTSRPVTGGSRVNQAARDQACCMGAPAATASGTSNNLPLRTS